MIRCLVFLLLFVPMLSTGQQFPEDRLEWNDKNETGELVKRTHWQPLVRPTLHNPLTAFFRFAKVDNDYYLQLKVMTGSDGSFVVARNAPCELMVWPNRSITVYNMAYQQSCVGCGSRAEKTNDPEGVTLTYPISEDDVALLLRRCSLYRVRINIGEMCFEKPLTPTRSKLFTDQVHLIVDSE
jgi:hypothetical protein